MLRLLSLFILFSSFAFAQGGGQVNGPRGFPQPEDTTTGVVQYSTAIINSSGNAIEANTTSLQVKTYIVLSATSTAAGNAVLALQGSLAPCTMDVTISSASGNYYVTNSSTVNGDCDASSSPPSPGTWVIGFLHDSSTTTGSTALVEVNGFWSGGPGTAHGFVVSEGPNGTVNFLSPPSTQGQFYCFYTLTSAASTDPVCQQSGLLPRGILGSTSTDTVSYQDNQDIVEHDQFGSSAVAESLPTPTTLNNPNFFYSYSNRSSFTDTITPVSPFTINSSPNLPVATNVFCRIYIDPNSSANWLSDCSSTGSGTGSGSSNAFTILTDAPTINWAVSGTESNAEVTITGNHALSISGATNGWNGQLIVKQDGTGNRQLMLPSGFYVQGGGAGAITLSSAANAVDRLNINYDGTNFYVDSPYLNYTKSAASGATFTVVERQVAFSSSSCATGLTITLGTATSGTSQGIFVSYAMANPSGAITVTDSAAQTYTSFGQLTGIGGHDTTGLFYLLGSASGVTSVTLKAATSATWCMMVAEHVSRSGGTWSVDQSKAALSTGQATPWSSPTATTTVANEFLVGYMEAYNTSGSCVMAATGSWTGTFETGSSAHNIGLLDQSVTSIQSNIAATGTTGTCTTFGSAGNYPGMITFK